MMPSPFDDLPGVVVVADDQVAGAEAAAAIAISGARLVATTSWAGALDRLSQQAAQPVLMIETAGVDDPTIAHVLPELVTAAGAANIVIAFELDRMDQVGGILIGTDATLLCDATAADRVAALVMARRTDVVDVRENREEAARLARINAEVARFTETLAQLTGTPQGQEAVAERSAIVGDRRLDFAQPDGDPAVTAAELRRAIRARRLRAEVFGSPGLFEDPAWDMLLDLFAAELERTQVSVSSLCIAAAVAPTTALRWINKLIAVGLFERRPDAFDRRRAYIALTARAVAALHDYVAALRRAGLSIA